MSEQELFARVVKILKPYVKNQEALAHATAETQILHDLGINSLRFVDIILEFENQFKIEITDEEFAKVRTIGDAIRGIGAKIVAIR